MTASRAKSVVQVTLRSPRREGRGPVAKAHAGEGGARNAGQGPTVTAGQERLILAAFDAGLGPAAIAKEFRVSRATVQRVITDAQRDRRRTER